VVSVIVPVFAVACGYGVETGGLLVGAHLAK
jgi:hypothetical protein